MSSISELPLSIVAVPAFKDNYLWLVMRAGFAAVVDPGEASVIENALRHFDVTLSAIVLTHHHADHTGGVGALVAARSETLPVFGPEAEHIAGVTVSLKGGDEIVVPGIDLTLEVIEVPGHTRGHIAYVGDDGDRPVLFCGDTLFAGGCGRLFEGTPSQMFDSLQKLARLPDRTSVFCAHEYTENNMRFALAVEPGNRTLRERAADVTEKRRHNVATVPSTMGLERATNPFLRVSVPEVHASVEREAPGTTVSDVGTFGALRSWKDRF
jgi:hydroxyacylglutathione hydrolase